MCSQESTSPWAQEYVSVGYCVRLLSLEVSAIAGQHRIPPATGRAHTGAAFVAGYQRLSCLTAL